MVLGDHQRFQGYTLFLSKQHVTELYHLPWEIRTRLLQEMSLVAESVAAVYHPDKMNYELLGNGDMLFLPGGASKPVRVQGTFVTDEEIGAVLSFIKSTSSAQYDEEMIAEMERRAVAEKGSKKGSDDDGDAGGALDAMFEQAVECVIDAGQASTSLLQRRCKMGYARAARIMDQMEQEKIIGPYEGAKPRAVLVTKAEWEERKLNGQYDGYALCPPGRGGCRLPAGACRVCRPAFGRQGQRSRLAAAARSARRTAPNRGKRSADCGRQHRRVCAGCGAGRWDLSSHERGDKFLF